MVWLGLLIVSVVPFAHSPPGTVLRGKRQIMNLVNGREGQREYTDGLGPVGKTTAPTMVSFGGEKESLIRGGGFSAFIRKQGRRTCPRSIYFYIAKPVSAIVAHAMVTGYGWVTLQQALKLRDELQMSDSEIVGYFNSGVRSTSVCAIRFGTIRQFANPVSFSTLLADFGMKPPQGIRDLDANTEYAICERAGFSPAELGQLRILQNESATTNPTMGKSE